MTDRDSLVVPDPDGSDSGDLPSRARRERIIDWEYVCDFREMARELESTDGIVEVEWEVADPVPSFTIETLEYGLGLDVPNRIKQLYLVADGLRLEWSIEEDGEVRPGGGIELFDFATVFDSWLDELWPTDGDPDEADFLWSLRGVARLPDETRSEMIVFCVEDEYPTYDLFLHDPETRRSERLALGFRHYLELLLETRATYGWHHLLAESPAQTDERRRHLDHFHDVQTHYLPDLDPTVLEDIRSSPSPPSSTDGSSNASDPET